MAISDYIFTSESVSEGHPDKICDRISDTILDAFLSRDPVARVAVEVLATTNLVVLAGEVRPDNLISPDEIETLVRAAIRDIGYEQDGFHWQTCTIDNHLHAQSADIARGVDTPQKLSTDTPNQEANHEANQEEGAGDQGIMFGYACRETSALMPAPIFYAHEILARLADLRKNHGAPLGPDSKSQVALVYEQGMPVRAHSIVLSTQHDASVSQADVRALVKPLIGDVLPAGWMCDDDMLYVNPTGQFIIGGPDGDAGLTGRKIIVDTYGGAAPHGGGAFSGKDPTKVDRSAAYAARYLAKNIVAAELADKCTLQLSYAIGVATPLAVYIDLHGSDKVSAAKLQSIVPQLMDLSPRGIRAHLGLSRPIYARTAAYGHFGRPPEADGGFSWERTDLIDALHRAL